MGKAARVRHMATDAGQHVLGTMVAGSSGHRRTHGERAAGACLGLLNGMRGAGGFYSLVGAERLRAADQSESGTERGRRRRRGRERGGAGRPAQDLPSPRATFAPRGCSRGCPLLRADAGVGRVKRQRSHTEMRCAHRLVGEKNRRQLVKAGNQLSDARRICVGVVERGGTPGVHHSSSLSLFGPKDPSNRASPTAQASSLY